jgi:hypothetical protein
VLGIKEKDKDGRKKIEVLKAVNILIAVFWDRMPCSLVTNVSEEHTASIFWVKSKNMFLRNLSSHLSHYIASHTTRPALLQKSQSEIRYNISISYILENTDISY